MGFSLTHMTAATLRAVLCYIDSGVTRKIAFDRDDLAEPLIKKIRDAVGDKGGSQPASIFFSSEEEELRRQFLGVCLNIRDIFDDVVSMGKRASA